MAVRDVTYLYTPKSFFGTLAVTCTPLQPKMHRFVYAPPEIRELIDFELFKDKQSPWACQLAASRRCGAARISTEANESVEAASASPTCCS